MLNTEESRAGAMACLNAIRIIEHIQSEPNPECTMERHWRDEEAGKMAMLHAAGVQSGFMAGFIATFAEYVSFDQSAGIPDPHVWKPETVMTEEEKAANRAHYEEAAA
ncbi:MAG: hypothetical protein A3K04_09650 [Gallionellales bacterium RBG_16_56_9]|nr:MAG: hypothetical protein A3K04_09650 [Gallionellales bacterium RBG_16_56_9]